MIKQISTLILFVGIAICSCVAGRFGTKTANAEEQKFMLSDNFNGGGESYNTEENISYAYKTTYKEYAIPGEVPDFHTMEGNCSCANVAGAIMITYYDRFCENLIPNYTSYRTIAGHISYKGTSTQTTQLMYTLYDLMGTDSEGTTFKGYQSGMSSYVSSCGYSYSTTDLGNVNMEAYISSIDNNRPVALFVDKFTLLDGIKTSNGSDNIMAHTFNGAHVVIGYGYKIERYYNSSNQLITSRTYLNVASGFSLEGLTYLCLDGKTVIDAAISTNIS